MQTCVTVSMQNNFNTTKQFSQLKNDKMQLDGVLLEYCDSVGKKNFPQSLLDYTFPNKIMEDQTDCF